jgi:hypothetical protein
MNRLSTSSRTGQRSRNGVYLQVPCIYRHHHSPHQSHVLNRGKVRGCRTDTERILMHRRLINEA